MTDSRDVTIRPAMIADLPRLGRLGAQLVEEHHRLDTARFLPTRDRTPADYAHFLIGQLGNPAVVILVADHLGDVVGYAYAVLEGYDYMMLRGPAGVLHDLVVDSAIRGQGVGTQLLDAALHALEARGATRIVLTTAARNQAAQRLFASRDFRPTMVEMTRDAGPPERDAQRQG